MEIKSLPTVAGTMEGGLRISQCSLRTTQLSVCIYINILLLRERKRERKVRDRGRKGSGKMGEDITGKEGKVHREER